MDEVVHSIFALLCPGSSGSTTFNNVPPRANDRPYILRVAANTSDGVRTVLRRVVRIGWFNSEQINIWHCDLKELD